MSEVRSLVGLLEAAYGGAAWHGPSLKDNLEGVTAAQAARRVGSAHSIWELVLHLAAWKGEIAQRLQGHEAGTPPEGDFPPAPDGQTATEAEWRKTLTWLDESQRALVAATRGLQDADLQNPVLDYRKNPSGEGATRYVTVVGIVQHDAYHSGQIAVLKRS